jgi:hypothetical protein
VRTRGSGNIGASNVWRTYGRRLGVPVVVLDTAKGFVPALVFSLTVSPLAGVLAGAGAMLGHARPLFLRFERGGKMGRDDRRRLPRHRAARRRGRRGRLGRPLPALPVRVARVDGRCAVAADRRGGHRLFLACDPVRGVRCGGSAVPAPRQREAAAARGGEALRPAPPR